jgi:hypothetical protein
MNPAVLDDTLIPAGLPPVAGRAIVLAAKLSTQGGSSRCRRSRIGLRLARRLDSRLVMMLLQRKLMMRLQRKTAAR